jgi:hypothetical protein
MPKRPSERFPDETLVDQAKPVPLHVAASVVHQQLVTSSRDWKDEHYAAILDSTALALSNVSDIYCVRSGRLVRIAEEELAVGMFEGGAKRFRTRSGNVYESLSMRRGDMAEAITVLKAARGAMHGADITADAELRKSAK